MQIEGAIFDFDGTLVDSMPMWDSLASTYIKERHGITPAPDLDERANAVNYYHITAWLKQTFSLPESVSEIDRGFDDIICRAYREEIKLKTGAGELLELLHQKGVKLCLVTATERRQMAPALKRLGIEHLFLGVFAGADKSIALPYDRALTFLGTEKKKTAVFEDAYYAISTAKRAGYPVVAVYDASAQSKTSRIRALADLYLPTIAEMEQHLD